MSEWTRSRYGHLYLDWGHTRYTIARNVTIHGPAGGHALFRNARRLNASRYGNGKPIFGWAFQNCDPVIFSSMDAAMLAVSRDIAQQG